MLYLRLCVTALLRAPDIALAFSQSYVSLWTQGRFNYKTLKDQLRLGDVSVTLRNRRNPPSDAATGLAPKK